jgi:branched-chain amino acid aminotransferase
MDFPLLTVFSGDSFLPLNKARLGMLDQALLYGYGICETMRSYGGKIFKLQDHLDRLMIAADFLSLDLFYTREEFEDILRQLLHRNALEDAVLRITIRNLETAGEGRCETRTLAVALPLVDIMGNARESGIELTTIRIFKGVQQAGDTGSLPPLLESLLAFLGRTNELLREGLLMDGGSIIEDGDAVNIFGVRGETIMTPALEPGVFPEVLRQIILEITRDMGLKSREKAVTIREFQSMDEIFMVGNRCEVLPVINFESRPVGRGIPGPVTLKVQQSFRKLVSESA